MLSKSLSARFLCCLVVILVGNNWASADLLQIIDLTLPKYPRVFAALRGEFDVTIKAMVGANSEIAQVEWVSATSLRAAHANILENQLLRAEILDTVKKWHVRIPGFVDSPVQTGLRPIKIKFEYRLVDRPGSGNCNDEAYCTAEYMIRQTDESIIIRVSALTSIHIN